MTMTSKILHKVLILIMCISSAVSCTVVRSTVVTTSTPFLDSTALQLWGNKDTSVGIKARLGMGSPNSLAMSPDGQVLAVGSTTGVYLYQFDTLKEIKRILFEQIVNTVEWSPNGNYLAVGSGSDVIVLDPTTGEKLYILSGHRVNVISIAWAPDSLKLASWALDQHMIVWDCPTRTLIHDERISEANTNLYLHWKSKSIVMIGPIQATMVMLDIITGAKSSQLIDSDILSYVTHVSWSSDDTALFIGGELGKVFVRDMQLDKLVRTYEENGTSVDSLAISPDNAFIAAGLRDGLIKVWDAETGSLLQVLQQKPGGPTNTVLDLKWSPDSKHLISLSRYKPITIWNIRKGEEIRSVDENTGWILDLAWSPSGDMLASGSEAGVIAIWESPSGRKLRSLQDPVGWIHCLTWSPDGKYIAGGAQGNITIWDVQTGKQLKTWSLNTLAVFGLTWSPDGSMLASLSYDGTGIIWDTSTWEKLRTLPSNRFSESIAWSPHSDLLGTSYPLNALGRDQVTLWNPQTGEPVRTLPGLRNLVWSPFEEIAASIWDNETAYLGDDTVVVIWNPETGDELRRFDTGIFLGDIAWSPEGKFLAVSEVILDAQTGEQLHRLKGHNDTVTKFAWSPRGDLVASASWDGTVIFWGINSP